MPAKEKVRKKQTGRPEEAISIRGTVVGTIGALCKTIPRAATLSATRKEFRAHGRMYTAGGCDGLIGLEGSGTGGIGAISSPRKLCSKPTAEAGVTTTVAFYRLFLPLVGYLTSTPRRYVAH